MPPIDTSEPATSAICNGRALIPVGPKGLELNDVDSMFRFARCYLQSGLNAEVENQPKSAGNEGPPSPVDPRDEAYTQVCEEIDKLERQERERLSCIRLQYKMVLAEYDLAMDCLDRHKADVLLGFLLGLSFSLGVLGNTEELPKSRYASGR